MVILAMPCAVSRRMSRYVPEAVQFTDRLLLERTLARLR
jgi:hypothetical protein